MENLSLTKLQERLGVRFKDSTLLKRALTHRSAATENSLDSNERLEFLGDAVVGLVVSENLFRLFPDYSEGDLAKSKAYSVSEPALAEAALALGLDAFVVMSAGEAASGGRRRRSVLSDAFEAVVGAIYLDCGIVTARRIVRQALIGAIQEVAADVHRLDYKSSLQEVTQAQSRQAPIYRIVRESGRDHEKTFLAEAVLNDRVIGVGEGHSKKEAEQAAAHNALEKLPSVFSGADEDTRTEAGIGVQ